MQPTRILSFALVLALLWAGCVSYALHDPCETDADCAEDQFCYGGLCQDPFPCLGDEECGPGQLCIEGNCLTPECLKAGDCPEGERCVDHVCTPCACLTDADCPADHVCQDGCICVERTDPPCVSDGDCLPWEQCQDGYCVARDNCASDGDCPAGQICQGGLCVDACGSDADCGQMFSCQDGHCVQRCFGDQTCFTPGTICENGVCVEAQCQDDADCAGEFVRCQGGRCEPYTPCEADADCGDPNWVCLEGICEELPRCTVDANCPPGLVCLDQHCHQPAGCASEADCAPGEDCVGGLCLPGGCRGPDDCPAGEVCTGGVCAPAGDPARVYSVVILTPGGPIHQGQALQLVAIALTQSGDQVPGIAFDWDSSAPARAAVDSAGVLTGGDEAGETLVTATAQGTSRESRTVTFTNVLAPDADAFRVQVVAAADRKPIVGATVMLVHGGGSETAQTDAAGQASFALPAGPRDVHVFADGRDYVSVLSTSANDLLVPLGLRTDGAKAGGFVGSMEIPAGVGMVTMGIAGLSFGGDLVDLNFLSLFGNLFNVPVDLGTGQAFSLPLPAQMVVGLEYMDIPIELKPNYYVQGQAGLRTAWGLGGRLNIDILTDLFSGGGATSLGEIITGLFPYFSIFDHGVQPVFDVRPLPLVPDADDVDGDGDTTELRPDWANFMDVDLAPDQPQTMSLSVQAPDLPSHGGSPVSTAMYLAGGLGELGFTPLGISAAEAQGGALPPLLMKMAPAHGGLEVGRYAVLVLAFPQTTGLFAPTDVAAVLYSGAALPSDVGFEQDFLPFPEDAFFHQASRTLIATGVAGASLYRFRLSSAQGGWTVYLPPAETLTFSLPAPPAGMADLAAGAEASLGPVGLDPALSYDDLVTFNGDDLDRLNRLTRSFTRFSL